MFHADRVIIGFPCGQGQPFGKGMLFSVEQAFVGRDEIRAPLKTSAWEATSSTPPHPPPQKKINPIKAEAYNPEASKFSLLSIKNHAGFFSCLIRSKKIFLPNYEVIWNQNQELKVHVSLSKK